MKAAVLVKYGSASSAFEIREINTPAPKENEVLIKVAAFGLNFADVMARNKMYKEAPPLPAVLGYDVAGTVESIGANVSNIQPGDQVFAMTRFGGYAEYAVTQAAAVAKIPAGTSMAAATALATQYCTAYYAAAEAANLFNGDKVLIHAGAGGVGTALIQYALYKGCKIFATVGSDEKVQLLSSMGVQHPINYKKEDFSGAVQKITAGKGVDAIFDAVGGIGVKKGMKLLAPGGKMICYGASDLTGKNIFGKISTALGFGFYHPVMLMMPSRGLIGLNMLRIADEKPAVLNRCLNEVVKLTEAAVFKPVVGKIFNAKDIAQGHDYLAGRQSIGKVVVQW